MNQRAVLMMGLLWLGCAEENIAQDPSGPTSTNSTGTGATDAGGSATTGTGANSDGGSNAGGANNGGAPTTGGSSGTGAMTPGLGYENGSRLRANVFVGADGSRQFKSWRDTELNIDCSFTRAEDGQMRCLPVFGPPFSSTPLYFADAACTVPASLLSCVEPTVTYGTEAGSCPSATKVWSLGPSLTTYYLKSGNSCLANSVTPGYSVWTRGDAVPASTFAQASIVTE